jgi:hypothetical protein
MRLLTAGVAMDCSGQKILPWCELLLLLSNLMSLLLQSERQDGQPVAQVSLEPFSAGDMSGKTQDRYFSESLH